MQLTINPTCEQKPNTICYLQQSNRIDITVLLLYFPPPTLVFARKLLHALFSLTPLTTPIRGGYAPKHNYILRYCGYIPSATPWSNHGSGDVHV